MAVALKKELTKMVSIDIQSIKHNDWLYIKDLVPNIHKESRYRTSKLSMLKVFELFNTTKNHKDYFCFLAWRDDKVIGLISGYCAEHYFTEDVYAYDTMFYVKPEYRKGRTALLLIRAFEKWAKENNIPLETTEDKLKAIQLYVKSEIERTGKPPAYNPFGKIFAKIGENARKKKFQSENPDVDYESQGIQDSIEVKQTEKNAVKKTYDEVVNSITEADRQEGFPDEEGNNGPHTQAYLTTVFDSMHIDKYIDNYDGDATIVVGGRSVKPRHIRECLAEKTGYDMPPGDRKGLKEHLKKKCRIDSESGGIIVKGKDGEKDFRLFKDEWRSAGTSSQKVASYYEDDMKECMMDKVDADRKANREKNGLGK